MAVAYIADAVADRVVASAAPRANPAKDSDRSRYCSATSPAVGLDRGGPCMHDASSQHNQPLDSHRNSTESVPMGVSGPSNHNRYGVLPSYSEDTASRRTSMFSSEFAASTGEGRSYQTSPSIPLDTPPAASTQVSAAA